jgi:hypothetical protein
VVENGGYMRTPEPTVTVRLDESVEFKRGKHLGQEKRQYVGRHVVVWKKEVSNDPPRAPLQLLVEESAKTDASIWVRKGVCVRNETDQVAPTAKQIRCFENVNDGLYIVLLLNLVPM